MSAFLISQPSCGSGEKPPVASLGKSHNLTPRRRQIASPFNGVQPPTTGRGQEGRSQRIRLRERTDYPQLTDVPSDLRVNGARHASRESLPPSKPSRPQKVESSRLRTSDRRARRLYCSKRGPAPHRVLRDILAGAVALGILVAGANLRKQLYQIRFARRYNFAYATA